MRAIITLLLALAFGLPAYAEKTLTLSEVFETASQSSKDIKMIDYDLKKGQYEIKFHRANAFPQITFATGINYISTSLLAQGAMGSEITMLYDRMDGATLNWNLSAFQPLITFGKVYAAIKIARLRRTGIKKIDQLNRDLFYLGLIQAFSNAYNAQKDLEIAQRAHEHATQLLKRMTIERDGGTVNERDFLRMQALQKKEEASLALAENQRIVTMDRLRLSAGIGETVDALSVEENSALFVGPGQSSGWSMGVQLKENEMLMLKYNKIRERSKYFPQVSLVGSIYNEYMMIDTVGMTQPYLDYLTSIGQSNPSISTLPFTIPGFDDYVNPDYLNYTVGLQLTWTIFSGLRNYSTASQAKMSYEKALLEYEKARDENETSVREAKKTVDVIAQNMDAVDAQLEAAQKAYDQVRKDYDGGFADMTELLDTEKQLREAEKLLIQIQIQRILAVAQLKISLGLPIYGEKK